jgi:hypothetical protein
MIEVGGFLLWLICIGISAIIIGYCIKYYGMEDSILKKEGFMILTCPSKTVKYITRRGETNCCNGDIVDNECNGNNVCSLSPMNSLGIQSCQTYASNVANEAAAANCITDMPYYFAATNGSLRGCSAAPATADGTAPSDPTQLQCILYPTDALDKVKLDSCFNYTLNKDMKAANAKCATTSAASAASNTPSVLGSIGSSITSAVSMPPNTPPPNPDVIWVIYGPGISGNLPVTKILKEQTPPGPITIYLAQDGQLVRGVIVDSGHTNNMASLLFTADLLQVTDAPIYSILQKYSGKYVQAPNKYNIKKSDGTNILTSS